MSDEKIHVEDETVEEVEKENEGSAWTEEFKVAGSEVVDFVKKLAHEATVRRIVIKNEKQNIHFEVPLLLGLGGIAFLPVYAALALIALLVTDCSILVTRAEKEPEPDLEIAVE
jgi:hypothetical protein